MPPREIGDQMKTCFEKMGPPSGMGEPSDRDMSQPRQAGPSGCKTPEECKVYCESHPEECQKFQPGPGVINPGNQMMPQQAGPGGCKGPEECKTYCESHLDECKNFGSGGGQQFAPSPMPSGYEGQPGGQFQPTGTDGCKTPEECQQKIQLQIQNQIQNQMMMPMNQPGEQPPTAPTPPSSGEMSPPSSFLAPQSLLGLILFIFTQAFRP